MSEERVVKVLFSGLQGRTGVEALKAVTRISGIKIVAGITRKLTGALDFDLGNGGCSKWYCYADIANPLKERPKDFDIIVDFSHPDVFEEVVELAVRTHVPLISGTSGLSDRQMAMLYDATNRIPVFRGGNFRFKVKKFIDQAVELAKTQNGNFTLYENFYEGKSLPSETSRVIQRRIFEATGKTIGVRSSANLPKEDLPCDWRIDLGTELRNNLRCHTVGFDELAHDVLEIAKVMVNKPIQKGEFYDLDEIWGDLPADVRMRA